MSYNNCNKRQVTLLTKVSLLNNGASSEKKGANNIERDKTSVKINIHLSPQGTSDIKWFPTLMVTWNLRSPSIIRIEIWIELDAFDHTIV